MMPGLSGDRLIRELRRRPELADVPIIVLSARADEALRIELLRDGAQDYVTKPCAREELLARVRTFIELQRRQRALEAALTCAAGHRRRRCCAARSWPSSAASPPASRTRSGIRSA